MGLPLAVFFLTLGSAVAAVLAIPAAGYVLLRARRTHLPNGPLAARLLLILVLAILLVYTLPYWNSTGIAPPDVQKWNLIPGRTIAMQLNALDRDTPAMMRQLAGNVLFFVPIGLLLPLGWQRARSFAITFLVGLGITVAIELTQLVMTYALPVWPRWADIDDVLLNASGVIIGWAVWRLTAGRTRARA
jgi:glycopeptide antibiotics resistance protein